MAINFNQLRLAWNLWAQPLFLIAASVIAQSVSKEVPRVLRALAIVIDWAALLMFAAGLCLLTVSTWKLWSASRGRGASCPNCGAPTRYVGSGRYGPYRRCMACGNTERAEV